MTSNLDPERLIDSFDPKPHSIDLPPIRYCIRCVMPETKPDLSIDDEGVCDACRSAEHKHEIDWDERREELKDLLERYRSKDGSNYDCIVPVSGGKDSTFQVMTILELGYRPLTVTWSACSYTEIGRKNIENMQKLGVDHIQFTPNPRVYRAMFTEAFRRVGDGCWPCHVGIFSYPVRVAVNYKVPLLVYGENPQLEYGGPAAKSRDSVIDRAWLEEFGGLLGNRIDDMLGVEGITEADLIPYRYPSDEELRRGRRHRHLPRLLHEVGRAQPAEEGARRPGSRSTRRSPTSATSPTRRAPTPTTRTSTASSSGCTTTSSSSSSASAAPPTTPRSTSATSESRARRPSSWCSTYEGKVPRRYLEEYLEFVGMTEDEFYETLDSFTNKAIFVTDDERPHRARRER